MKASGDVAIWSLFESLQGPAPDSFFALAGPSSTEFESADSTTDSPPIQTLTDTSVP